MAPWSSRTSYAAPDGPQLPDRPVDPAVVDRALANATRAPNAGFSQGWAFLVLDTPEDVRRFWAATADDRSTRPRRLAGRDDAGAGGDLPCSSKAAYLDRYAEPDKGWTDRDEARWPVPFWHIDTAMAALLILQTAVDEGLGACFFGIPPDRDAAVREEFGIPDDFDPVGVVTVGHRGTARAAGSPRRRARASRSADVVHRGRWATTRRLQSIGVADRRSTTGPARRVSHPRRPGRAVASARPEQ